MQVEGFFHGFKKFGEKGGFKPGLERVRYMLDALGGPDKELNIFHVGGTNGKGSTISFLNSIYSAAGYSTGTYISPPLSDFRERITCNGHPIGEEELESVVERLEPVVKEINPSFFEVVTVAALVYFQEMAPDIVLLEVGLGGRLDATNAVDSPLASIITSIGLEHTSILGETLSEIASEKAGIIRKGVPVITGVKGKRALAVIRERAREKSSKLIEVDANCSYEIIESDLGGQRIRMETDFFQGVVDCGLAGEHQARNAALALVTVGELNDKFQVAPAALKRGMAEVVWPGRMEVVRKNPAVILDGAHNPRAAGFLCDHIRRHLSPEQYIRIIIGVLRDKDFSGILGALEGLTDEHEVEFILTASSSSRAADPQELVESVQNRGLRYRVIPDLKEAIERTLIYTGNKGIIIITGSLYTVGEARKLL